MDSTQVAPRGELAARTIRLARSARHWVGIGLAIAITVVSWGSAFVGIRAGLRAYSPTHLALLRYGTASLVLAVYAVASRMPLPRWRDVPGLVLTGIVGIAYYNVALNTGEVTISAGLSSFLVNAGPIFTALLAMGLLKEHLSAIGWAGVAISAFGVSVIMLSTGEGLHFSGGAVLILSAALAQSIYFILQKPYLTRYNALQCTTFAIWAGTLALMIFSPGFITQVRAAPWPATEAGVYLGIVPAALGYMAWAYTLARIPATRAASFLYVVPAVAIGIAWVWLGEQPTWLAIMGGVIAITGVIVVSVWGRSRMGDSGHS